MQKKLIYCLVGGLAAVGFGFVLTVAVNAFDPALDPEVSRVIGSPPVCTEKQMSAYFYVLGMYQGAKVDTELAGAALWLKHEEPDFWKTLSKSPPWQNDFHGCPHETCTAEALERDPKLREALSTYHDQIESYAKLMNYGEGCTLFAGDNKTFFSPISALPYAMHRLLVLQMADWAVHGDSQKVREMLIASNHYAESFYHNGSLLERLIAVSIQMQNAAFLKSEIARNAKFAVTPELVSSFVPPDINALTEGAMDSELRVIDHLVHADFHLLDLQVAPWDEIFGLSYISKAIPTRAFMRPNETLNRFHVISGEFLNCKKNEDPQACVPDLKWVEFSNPWHMIENPAGRMLSKIILPSYFARRDRLIQKREELANLQAEFRAKIAPAHFRKTN